MLAVILLAILEFTFVVGVIVYVIFLIQDISGGAPFIPIPDEILPYIDKALELGNQKAVLYDLGSGDGRVLEYVLKRHSHVQGIGIDRAFLPHILATFKRIPRARFARANFFDASFGDATHVFVYLFPELLDKMLPKLNDELKPGTRLVSCDFFFAHKKPLQVIDLKRGTKRGQKLYVYEF